MDFMAKTRRPKSAAAARSLRAVPDYEAASVEEPAPWDSRDLGRMARLGQAFAATGAPDETLQLIAGARSIDDAMDRLAAAGLLPSEEESRRGLTSWFTPLLEPGCDQLDADLLGSSFLGMMRAACADYPAELE